MTVRIFAATLVALVSVPVVAQSPSDLSIERVFASPGLEGSAPREVKVSPDGRYVTVLRNRDSDRDRYDLWGFDRTTGQWTMLVDSLKLSSGKALSEAEKMQRERKRIGDLKGIVAYEWSADSKSILVPLDGDLYLAGIDGSVKRLTDSKESELNPTLSETGKSVAFVLDQNLWAGPAGGKAVRLTADGKGTVHWGEAEFVAQEELDRSTGYWWAPGDKYIAVERFDEKPVEVVTRTAIGAETTTVFEQRYPRAGTANALVDLYVLNPQTKAKVKVDLGPSHDIYFARADWAKDGKTLYVQRLDRAQTRLDMLAVDPATGKSRLLFTEKAGEKDWVNLGDNYKWLKDGSLIWWSERDGYGHLYRFKDGQWTQLTKGPWVVTSLAGVDEKAGRVFFVGTKDDVLATQLYSLPLDGSEEPQRLSEPGFSTAAKMDKSGQTLVVTRSSQDQPGQTYIADQTGKRLAWVEENRLDERHPYAPYLASHRPTQFGTIKAADGTELHWSMIGPVLVPGKRYPVIFQHYGGPHDQEVRKAWVRNTPLWQALVDKGYIIFSIDNRGSANRGRAFEKPLWHAFGSVEVEDQLAGLAFLKTQPFVDPRRIATWGWSYGGYMTLKLMEAAPGAFAAGIAGAPVTKWELYDTAYTERYLGDPTKLPDVYTKSGALAEAAKIRDPLLVVHGMSDDNVVFPNSTALFAELQGKAVPFEMMTYPGQTHRVSGPKISVHLWNTILGFLARNGVPPGGR